MLHRSDEEQFSAQKKPMLHDYMIGSGKDTRKGNKSSFVGNNFHSSDYRTGMKDITLKSETSIEVWNALQSGLHSTQKKDSQESPSNTTYKQSFKYK